MPRHSHRRFSACPFVRSDREVPSQRTGRDCLETQCGRGRQTASRPLALSHRGLPKARKFPAISFPPSLNHNHCGKLVARTGKRPARLGCLTGSQFAYFRLPVMKLRGVFRSQNQTGTYYSRRPVTKRLCPGPLARAYRLAHKCGHRVERNLPPRPPGWGRGAGNVSPLNELVLPASDVAGENWWCPDNAWPPQATRLRQTSGRGNKCW